MKKVSSKDGTIITYNQSGNGYPVILVDGALCSHVIGPMPKLAALLAAHFTVINYDRRGRYNSGDTQPYAVEREIEDLDALIHLVGGEACVFGISSGAALALQAAAKGLRIKKLALYEPPFANLGNGPGAPVNAKEQLDSMIASNRRGDAVKFFLKDMVGVPAFVVGMMRLFPVWSKLKAVANTLPYDVAIMGDFSFPDKIAASVKTPALVAGGGKSTAKLVQAVEKLGTVLPNSKTVILQGQNHNVAVKILAPVLIDFFKQ
jgi:pimeloyl-ACP methyl ester carboxylesterase